MKPEKKHSVTTDGVASKEYNMSELTWLWRTAQLPDLAQYRDDNGEWRPVKELVEPIIEAENRRNEEPKPKPRTSGDPDRPLKILAWLVLIFLICAAIKVAYRILTMP